MCLKSIIKKHVLLIALTGVYSILNAQTLSLNNVLDSVERNNPLIASYSFKINAANSLAAGAKSWMPPMIGIGYDQTPYSLANGETFFNRNQGSTLIMVQQDIPNPGKQKAKQNYLSSLAAVDSAEFYSTKNKLFTEAKKEYIERYIAEKRLKIIDEEIDLLRFIIQTATSAYANNQSDLPSIFKAKARQHALEAMRVHESSAIAEANSKLNSLMNLPQNTKFLIDSIVPFHNYKISELDTNSTYIAMHRSEIQKLERTINSMQLNNALALSASKPDFSIRYEHYNMFGSRNTFSLMGLMTIPIVPWAKKSYLSESRSIKLIIEAFHYEKLNTINEARSAILQSLLHTLAEYHEVNYYVNEIIPAYKKAFDASRLAYRNNTNTLIFTLMSWDDLNMSQMEYLYHLEQAYKSEIEYENAIEKR